MIEIYGSWIDRFGIDGFRIDTARHVNPEFWQAFEPAMIERAKARGIPNFHIFSEVATGEIDPGYLARWSHIAHLSAPLDMAFAAAMQQAVGGKIGTDKVARLFEDDALYRGGEKAALRLPTFLGNHDFGRFSMFVKQANPGISQEELFDRGCPGPRHDADPCAACRRSITGMSRALFPTATTSWRGKTCSPARWRSTTTMT